MSSGNEKVYFLHSLKKYSATKKRQQWPLFLEVTVNWYKRPIIFWFWKLFFKPDSNNLHPLFLQYSDIIINQEWTIESSRHWAIASIHFLHPDHQNKQTKHLTLYILVENQTDSILRLMTTLRKKNYIVRIVSIVIWHIGK